MFWEEIPFLNTGMWLEYTFVGKHQILGALWYWLSRQPQNFENVTAAKFWKRDSREILKTWQPRNFENVTLLVARRREHLRIFLAIFFVAPLPQKKTVFGHVIMHLDAWYGSHVSSKNSMPSPSATQRESIGRASAGIPSNTTTRSQTHVRQWKSEHWFSNNTWTMGWLRLVGSFKS